MPVSKALLSSNKSEWLTPKWLFNQLDSEFHFKLDAATHESNPLATEYFYTEQDNGLEKDWMNSTYCNPPYGVKVGKWIEKASIEQQKGNTVVMLLPSRTDTRWFHNYIYKKPNVEIRFIKGRLTFYPLGDANYEYTETPRKSFENNVSPFPSMIVIFRVD